MISTVYQWLGRHRRAFVVPAAGLLLLVIAEAYVQIRFGESAVPGPVDLYAVVIAVVTLVMLTVGVAGKLAQDIAEQTCGQLVELRVVRIMSEPVSPRDRFGRADLRAVPDDPMSWARPTDHGVVYGQPAVERGEAAVDPWVGFVRSYGATAQEPEVQSGGEDTKDIGRAS